MNVKTLLSSLLVAASAFGPAWAQTYPAKTISLIVPYPAGGPSDFFARRVQPDAATRLGKQPMIIENIGGAGGAEEFQGGTQAGRPLAHGQDLRRSFLPPGPPPWRSN